MKVPHHCSYKSLGPDKGDDVTEPAEKVARLYEHYGREGAVLVSPSNVVPESDETQPPHVQAAEYYRKVAEEKKGQFKVTMEHPTQEEPKPMKVEVERTGAWCHCGRGEFFKPQRKSPYDPYQDPESRKGGMRPGAD